MPDVKGNGFGRGFCALIGMCNILRLNISTYMHITHVYVIVASKGKHFRTYPASQEAHALLASFNETATVIISSY